MGALRMVEGNRQGEPLCPGPPCPIVTGLGDLVWPGNRDVKIGS